MSLDLKSNVHQINLTDSKSPDRTIYEFEGFHLDAEHLMLSRSGEELPLTPKQVQTLLALAERHGEIVTKDALMNRLWGDAAVEESNLVQNIYVLRKTLGRSSGGKPMIETLRRRGYRFNGELKQNGAGPVAFAEVGTAQVISPKKDEKTFVPDQQSNRLFSGPKWIAALAIFLAAVGLVTIGLLYKLRSPSAAAGKVRFAALPLKPVDPANRDSLYENGIADALITRVSSVQVFEVRSLNDVRDYNDIAQDPVAVGRQQKVDYVLAPKYQLADGKIRITAPLINIATGKVEETYTFEKETSSHFAVQDAVAADFGAKLIGRFGGTDPGHQAKRGTNNEEAYQLYLQAIYLCDKKRSEDSISKAIAYLEQAVQLDPNYAEAWAAKALAHRYAAYSVADQSEQHQRSIEAINRALAIDPDLPEAYSALCDNKFTYEYDLAGAEAACKRAVELGPNSSTAHQVYSHFLVSRGRRGEALAQIQIADDLAPTAYFVKRNYANTFYLSRQYDEAIKRYKQVIDLNPTNLGTYQWLIRALEEQGNEAEAFEWLIRSLIVQGVDNETVKRFRDTYRTDGWRAVLIERIDLEKQTRPSDWRNAMGYAQVGDRDKAFEYLKKMYEQRNYFLHLLKEEPQLDPIRDDPRYADLVRRVEGH